MIKLRVESVSDAIYKLLIPPKDLFVYCQALTDTSADITNLVIKYGLMIPVLSVKRELFAQQKLT